MSKKGFLIFRLRSEDLLFLLKQGYDIRRKKDLEKQRKYRFSSLMGWERGLREIGFQPETIDKTTFTVPIFLRFLSPKLYLFFARAVRHFRISRTIDNFFLNIYLIARIIFERPRFIFYSSKDIFRLTFFFCKKVNCTIIDWFGDVPQIRGPKRKRNAQQIADYVISGIALDKLLPGITDKFFQIKVGPSEEFAKLLESSKEKPIDVCVAGHFGKNIYSIRSEIINELLKNFSDSSLNIKAYGIKFGKGKLDEEFPHLRNSLEEPRYGRDYIGLLKSSKIFINIPADPSIKIDDHRPRATFECVAAKCFQLAYNTKGVTDLFEPGEEIVVFNDWKDLVDKIKYYLSRPEERERIVQNAYKRFVSNYAAEIQIKKVFKKIFGKELNKNSL